MTKYSYKNKNIIVTGGGGFIGQNLVNALVNLGANVYVIENFLFGAKRENINPKAIIVEGDIRSHETFLRLPSMEYDLFFHFAAPSSITLFKRNLSDCADITISGFMNAINFCARNNIRLVYPSSGSLYAGVKTSQDEKAIIDWEVINSYAKCKYILEKIADTYRPAVDSIGLRIFASYGCEEKQKGEFASVVYMFCKDMFDGKRPVIWGDGTQERDFVFIEDVIKIILDIAPSCKEKIINIGSGEATSFNKVIKAISEELNIGIKPEFIEKPMSYLEKTLSDNTTLKKYHQEKMQKLYEGVKKIIKSFKES